MKLFDGTNKLIDKTKNEENVPILMVAEVFLVQYNLANDQYQQNLSNTYGKQLLDAATKTGVGAVKNSSKKLAYKAAEATGGFIRNKIEIAKLVKAKLVTEPNSRNVEQIFIPL